MLSTPVRFCSAERIGSILEEPCPEFLIESECDRVRICRQDEKPNTQIVNMACEPTRGEVVGFGIDKEERFTESSPALASDLGLDHRRIYRRRSTVRSWVISAALCVSAAR